MEKNPNKFIIIFISDMDCVVKTFQSNYLHHISIRVYCAKNCQKIIF